MKKKRIFYKPVRVSNFWSNNYIEYESSGDKNKTLSVKEYLNKTRPYLKDIINHKKSGTEKSINNSKQFYFFCRQWWTACNAFKKW